MTNNGIREGGGEGGERGLLDELKDSLENWEIVWSCLECVIRFNIRKWPISRLLDKNNVDITHFIHHYSYFSQKLQNDH
jgi:hypothetical protein